MKDGLILGFCRKNGIYLPLNWRSCCQTVRYHNKAETEQHFIYKAFIAFKLMQLGQTVFTEFKFDYGKRTGLTEPRMRFPTCDIFWLDEKMIIELETNFSEKTKALKREQFRDFNLFVFDIQRYSVDDIMKKIGVI